MRELYLDGHLAVLSDEQQIKLTAENIYFTKSSSYTYEIELPAEARENKEIFGDITRMDISKNDMRLPARMIVDNIEVLTGEAHITSVANDKIKIQLLGAAAAYNYGNKMDDTYIDQLDMGDWFWETWPDGTYYLRGWSRFEEGDQIMYAIEVYYRAYYKGPEYGDAKWTEQEIISKFINGDFGWVAYPTYNNAADYRHNVIAWQETDEGSRDYTQFLRRYEGEVTGFHRYPDAQTPVSTFSIQPYIWKVAELVAKATGFTLDKGDNALYQDIFYRKIFIVSTSTSALVSSGLPHWRVNEFWTQIENTFGVVMTLNYATMRMKLSKRSDHYNMAGEIVIRDVVREYETSMDDETEKDISSNNVGFSDYDPNPEDVLSEEILNNAQTMDFDSIEGLLEWCNGEPNLSDYKNYIFKCANGRQFIYSKNVHDQPGIIEVNMLRPRMTNENGDNVEIELKIVPARYSKQNSDLFGTWVVPPGANNPHRDLPVGTFEVIMLDVPGVEVTKIDKDYADVMDIAAVLEEEEEVESKQDTSNDLMYIAITNPGNFDTYTPKIVLSEDETITQTFNFPRGLLRERSYSTDFEDLEFEDAGESLSLIPIYGQTNLANKTITDLISIRAVVRYCIKFISDTIPDPGAIFLIGNKRYVCEKIEANIKPGGLDKLLTGYFYEFSK